MEFRKYKLSDIGQIITGKTPSSKVDNAFSNSSGTPFVTPKDMDGRREISATERYLTKNGLQSVSNYLIPEKSVAVSCIGSDMGKTIIIPSVSVTNQQINSIIINQKFNYKYIYYCLSTKQQEFKSIAGGSATPILNKGHFSQFELDIPDREYQDKVVDILDTFDQKIQLNNETNATLEQIAQAIFKSWFIDFDPVHAKAHAHQQALAEGKTDSQAQHLANVQAMQVISGKTADELAHMEQIQPSDYAQLLATADAFPSGFNDEGLPRGWMEKNLGDLITIKRGGSPRPIKNFITNNGLNWVKIADATSEKSPFLFKTKECIKEEGLKKTVLLKKGSLILSNSATPGLPKFLDIDACIHDGWLYFPEINILTPQYLYFLFLDMRKRLVAQGNGSVFTNLKTDIVKSQVVTVATTEVLFLFSELIKTILEDIKNNCHQTHTLISIRDTLLPKLLSGEMNID